MAISKNEFIAAIAAQTNVAPDTAEAMLKAVSDIAARQLAIDGAVRVPGLVNIEAKKCSARPGRNMRTGEACMIPEATRVRVSPSAPLETKYRAESARQAG